MKNKFKLNYYSQTNTATQTKIYLLLFSLIFILSCNRQNKNISNDIVTEQTSVATKEAYNKIFEANTVSQIGKAINCIFQDKKGNYWFASNGEGAFRYDGKTLIQFTKKDGLSDDQVFTIQQDQQGNIWLLTVSSISCFDGKTFITYPNKYNIDVQNDINLKIEADDLWFEFGGGAYHYQSNSFSYLLLPNSDLDSKQFNPTNPKNPDARKVNAYSVYCSMKDKKGNLWLGTQTLGVCRYDGKTFTWFTEKGLSGPAVRALFEDRNGNMWFGNNGNGLFRYDGKNLINFTEEKGLGNPDFLKTAKSKQGTLARVWTINEDNSRNIWIGTYDSGVWRYDGKNLTNYTTKDGLTSNAINTIFKDNNGELWFGTDGAGVCKFNGISFSGFSVNSLLK
jgi:ligand-binding sensor domain-containing protein